MKMTSQAVALNQSYKTLTEHFRNNMASMKARDKRTTYIYRLPYSITQQICSNLDVDKAWSKLASEIGYTYQDVKTFELCYHCPSGSPTDRLLSDWGCRNPTATDLYNKLKSINRRREMQILEAWFTSSEDVTIPQNASAVSNSSNDVDSNILQDLDKPALPKPPLPGRTMITGDNGKRSSPKSSQCNGNVNVNIDKGSSGSKFMPDKMMEGKDIAALDKRYNNKVIPGKDKVAMATQSKDKLHRPSKDLKMDISDKGEKSLSSVQENKVSMTGSPEDSKGNMGSKSMKEIIYGRLESCNGCSIDEKCDFDDAVAMMGTQSFSYKEINQATNGFSENQKIGQGVYGEVFVGRLKNTNCAIKRLFPSKEGSGDEHSSQKHLKSELKILTRYRHENIVSLYGYTLDGTEICLVYQHMPNGSLQDKLHCKDGSKPLSWQQRLTIMKGAACGLQYLHTLDSSTPLIHGDMKCTNILLDKHMEAKISDLGMARHATSGTSGVLTHITKEQTDTKQYQDRAYLPPESLRGSNMSIKGDTYSFGVVLMEVCSGEKAYDEKREGSEAASLVSYVKNRLEDSGDKYIAPDPKGGNCPEQLYSRFFEIALNCTEHVKKRRPDMVKVYKDLEDLEISWSELAAVDHSLVESSGKTCMDSTDHSTSNSNNMIYGSGLYLQECQQGLSPLVIAQPQDSSCPQVPFDQMPDSYKLQALYDAGKLKTPDTADGNDFHNDFMSKEKCFDKNPSDEESVHNISDGSSGILSANTCSVCTSVSVDDNSALPDKLTDVCHKGEYVSNKSTDKIFHIQDYENTVYQNKSEETEMCQQQQREDFFKDYEEAVQKMAQCPIGEDYGECEGVSFDFGSVVVEDICEQLNVTENRSPVETVELSEKSYSEEAECENCGKTEDSGEENETFSSGDFILHKQKYKIYKEIEDKINQNESGIDNRQTLLCQQSSNHDNQDCDQSQNSLQEMSNDDSNLFASRLSPSNVSWQQNRAEPSESEEFV